MRIGLTSQALATVMAGAISMHAWALTQADVDAAKTNADLQEQLKRDSDARAAIAKNQLEIANGEAAARAALAKTQIEAEKARSEYYQSLIPDPTKYKVAPPGAPKLAARAARMSFVETSAAAEDIVGAVKAATGTVMSGNCTTPAWILPGSGATAIRSLVTYSLSIESALQHLTAQIASSRRDLLTEVGEPTRSPGTATTIQQSSVAVAAAAVQGVLSMATILKPQYALDSIDQSTLSASILEARTFGAMATLTTCFTVVDPNALLSLVPLSPPDASQLPRAIALLESARQELAGARTDVRNALQAAQGVKDEADRLRGDKTKKSEVTAKDAKAARILATAKTLTDLANDAEKALMALYAVDTQGASPIDSAVRGGMLRDALAPNRNSTYFLTLKTIASDVDLASKDGLFVKASTSIASNTVVSWQLSNVLGKVISAGAVNRSTPTQIEAVWPD